MQSGLEKKFLQRCDEHPANGWVRQMHDKDIRVYVSGNDYDYFLEKTMNGGIPPYPPTETRQAKSTTYETIFDKKYLVKLEKEAYKEKNDTIERYSLEARVIGEKEPIHISSSYMGESKLETLFRKIDRQYHNLPWGLVQKKQNSWKDIPTQLPYRKSKKQKNRKKRDRCSQN